MTDKEHKEDVSMFRNCLGLAVLCWVTFGACLYCNRSFQPALEVLPVALAGYAAIQFTVLVICSARFWWWIQVIVRSLLGNL